MNSTDEWSQETTKGSTTEISNIILTSETTRKVDTVITTSREINKLGSDILKALDTAGPSTDTRTSQVVSSSLESMSAQKRWLRKAYQVVEVSKGRVEELLHGSDGNVRGVSLRVQSGDRRPILLRRPVQHIYSLETDVVPSGLQEPATDQGEHLVDSIIERIRILIVPEEQQPRPPDLGYRNY
eukprot:Em0007g6a